MPPQKVIHYPTVKLLAILFAPIAGLRTLFMVSLFVGLQAAIVFAEPYGDALSAYNRGDYTTALQIWRTQADRGHAGAQYNLGIMYVTGQGVPQDYAQAYMWLNLAWLNLAASGPGLSILPTRSDGNLGALSSAGMVSQPFIFANLCEQLEDAQTFMLPSFYDVLDTHVYLLITGAKHPAAVRDTAASNRVVGNGLRVTFPSGRSHPI